MRFPVSVAVCAVSDQDTVTLATREFVSLEEHHCTSIYLDSPMMPGTRCYSDRPGVHVMLMLTFARPASAYRIRLTIVRVTAQHNLLVSLNGFPKGHESPQRSASIRKPTAPFRKVLADLGPRGSTTSPGRSCL